MSKKTPLSVVVSAYNEEEKIEDCLRSIDFANEIIFVDNESNDKTVEIAKKFTSKIFIKPNNLMLNVNKNFGFSKATSDWILSLDADERVTKELAQELESKIRENKKEVNGFWVPRKNILFGKWIQNSIWWPDYQLRLFRRGKGRFPEQHVHEYIQVDGETEKVTEPLLHYNYSSITEFLRKMDTIYTENEVKNLLAKKHDFAWFDAIRFPFNDFLKTYFAQKGYKDGLHGLVLSILQAFYAEVVFAKMWEKNNFKEQQVTLVEVKKEMKKAKLELLYWFYSCMIDESRNVINTMRFKVIRRSIKNRLERIK